MEMLAKTSAHPRAAGRAKWSAVRIGILSCLLSSGSAYADQAYRPNWQVVEADNGAKYQIDVNSITHFSNGAADIVVYSVEGQGYNPANMTRLFFDCRGHFRDNANPGADLYAAPHSVAGRIGEIACKRTN